MSMTIEQKRAEVAKLYSGQKWRDKVAKMSNDQIGAIYNHQVLNRANGQGGGKGGR